MKTALAVLLFISILVLLILFVSTKRLILQASETIHVYEYPTPGVTPIKSLEKGQRVKVLSCDDFKSYLAVHVRLPDGSDGYVVEGRYFIDSVPIWHGFLDGSIMLTCQAL